MKNEIYVDVRHTNFWWGLYGLTALTDWEDLLFYEKEAETFVWMGTVCVCSRTYLQNGLADLEQDLGEKDFVEEIKHFLQQDQIVYRYSYAGPEDEDGYEVPFEAQRNEQGRKPESIEMWYPREGIGMDAIEACARAFCHKFLNKEVDAVFLKEIAPFVQTEQQYREHMARLYKEEVIQVRFTEELVALLARHWKMPAEEVGKRLLRSV